MVQIYEDAPSFAQQMARGLGTTAGKFGAGMLEGHVEKNKEDAASKKFKEQFGLDLSKEGREAFMKSFGKSAGEQPFKEKLEERKRQEEEFKKDQELNQEIQEWEGIFDDLEELTPYVGMSLPFTKTMWAKLPWSTAKEKRESFDVAAFQLERFARSAHTKGALSTKVYESLLSKLPDSELSEAQNRGRIKQWKKAILEVKQNRKKVLSGQKQEMKSEKPPLESYFE